MINHCVQLSHTSREQSESRSQMNIYILRNSNGYLQTHELFQEETKFSELKLIS